MKQVINKILHEQFEYYDRKLDFSIPRLELSLQPDEDAEGTFVIYGPEDRPATGLISSTEIRMELLSNSFSGSQYEVAYHFHARGLNSGDVLQGDFRIVSNQGEYMLPFVVTIEKKKIESSMGDIRNLFHYANLAKSNWDEAVNLFYSNEFADIFNGNDSQYESLYRGLLNQHGSERSVEEFLLSINKKTKVEYTADMKEIVIENPVHSTDHVLQLTRIGWGYTRLDIDLDGDFLETDTGMLNDHDFLGNTCYFHFQLNADKLHDGNNYGSITFSNEYTSLTIPVTVMVSFLDQKPTAEYHEKKELTIKLMQTYQAFRSKKMGSRAWLTETGKIISRMNVVDPKDIAFRLYSAQYMITASRVNEGQWILEQLKPEMEMNPKRDDTLYAYYLYLTTLGSREEEFINEVSDKIEAIYKSNPDNWRVAWLLQYVSEDYLSSETKRWEMFEYLFRCGCRSPIIYIEALIMLSQSPTLLSKMGKFELFILEYGANKGILSVNLIDQIIYIGAREKQYSQRLYDILKKCFRAKQTDEALEAICSLLIKGNVVTPEAFSWYARGVERELRITRLYEYYMMSIYKDSNGNLPCEISKMVLMYFSYQSDLPYEKNAILYRYIYENRETYSELYETYRPRIEKFLMGQLDKGRISKDLGYLYMHLMSRQMVDATNCSKVLSVLYTHELTVDNPEIIRALVVYEKCEKEMEYPVRDCKAFVPIYGADYAILFEDEDGNRYYSSVKYIEDKLMNPTGLAEYAIPYIQKGQENLDLFLCELGKDAYSITLENVGRYRELAGSRYVRSSSRNEITNNLIRFYYDNDFTRQLTEYLEEIDPNNLSTNERNQVIEIMVHVGMYERALSWIKWYGTFGIDPKVLVRLCGRHIDMGNFEDDEENIQIAFYAFSKGKYDEQLLAFLADNYNGSAREMRDIWKAARSFGVDVYKLSERILLQMLYSGAYVGEKTSILREYIKGGSNTDVEKAYLSQCAYDNFVRDAITDGYIFDRIGRLHEEGEDLPDVCKLAYLRFYSEQNVDMGQNMETTRQFLEDIDLSGRYFPFFQKYVSDIPAMQKYADKTMIEYRTKPGIKCMIHYFISTGREDVDGEYKQFEMKEMYDGIHVASFVLFFGEEIQYYITEIADESENGADSKLTVSGTISKSDIVQAVSSDRFTIINDIMIGETLQDYDTVDKLMAEYYKKRFMSKKLFHAVK